MWMLYHQRKRMLLYVYTIYHVVVISKFISEIFLQFLGQQIKSFLQKLVGRIDKLLFVMYYEKNILNY